MMKKFILILVLCFCLVKPAFAWFDGGWTGACEYLQRVACSIIPASDATYDLGSSDKQFNDLYVAGTIHGSNVSQIWLQGTAALSDGTTNGKFTYMDASPHGEWVAIDSDVVTTTDSTYYKEGSTSLKIAYATGAEVADTVTLTTSSEDWSGRESLGFWVRSDTVLSGADFKIKIADGGYGDTLINFPAVPVADTWQWVELDIKDATIATEKKDDVDAIAIVYGVDKGEMNIYFDFLARWDLSDETTLDQKVNNFINVIVCASAQDQAMDWSTSLTEYTHYFIHRETTTDFWIPITADPAAKAGIFLYEYE